MLGDGVMAFFGWPRAHEDDAVRAVHAALDTLSAVTNISGPVTLASRVGVCSGPVVVRDIGAGGAAGSMDAVGETPNIAARLQTLATPNSRADLSLDETSDIGGLRPSRSRLPGAERCN